MSEEPKFTPLQQQAVDLSKHVVDQIAPIIFRTTSLVADNPTMVFGIQMHVAMGLLLAALQEVKDSGLDGSEKALESAKLFCITMISEL